MALCSKGLAGTVAAIGTAMLVASVSYAQMATTLEQAELAGLTPEKRADIEARLKQGGQTVSEILQTELLNSIKLKHLGSEIVALDFNRGIAIVRTANGEMRSVHFNTKTLAIES